MYDQSLQGRQRHLIADSLDHLGRIIRIPFFELIARRVVVLAALKLLEAADHGAVIARHPDRRGRFERVHDADHVRRTELRLDKPGQRRTDRHARAAAHVIIVEEDREQPDVLARRFGLFVVVAADFPGRLVDRGSGSAVELHELEGFDLLRLAVFRDLEIGRLQVGDLIAVAVRNDDVHAHEVDACAEHRLLRIGRWWLFRGRLLALRRWLTLRGLLSLRVAGDAQEREYRRGGRDGPEGTSHMK